MFQSSFVIHSDIMRFESFCFVSRKTTVKTYWWEILSFIETYLHLQKSTTCCCSRKAINLFRVYLSTADILECDIDQHDCDVNADCEDVPGSYICTCREGFKGDGKSCKGKQNSAITS